MNLLFLVSDSLTFFFTEDVALKKGLKLRTTVVGNDSAMRKESDPVSSAHTINPSASTANDNEAWKKTKAHRRAIEEEATVALEATDRLRVNPSRQSRRLNSLKALENAKLAEKSAPLVHDRSHSADPQVSSF